MMVFSWSRNTCIIRITSLQGVVVVDYTHTFSHIINSRVSCKTRIGSSVPSCGNFRIPDPTFCNVTVLLQTCSSVWLDFLSSYLIALQIRYITTICLSSGSCPWNYSGVGSSVAVVCLSLLTCLHTDSLGAVIVGGWSTARLSPKEMRDQWPWCFDSTNDYNLPYHHFKHAA